MQNEDESVSLSGMLPALTGTATASTQTNFSILHLLSACLFARRVNELEVQNAGKEFSGFWEDIFGHATATVLVTVAALESYINEVFANSQRNFPEVREDIPLMILEEYEKKRLIDKFDLALSLNGLEKLDRGVSPVQDVLLLVQLRNALIHFKPEWDNEERDHAKMSDKLRYRFDKSPFLKDEIRMFPKAWAGHGCCVWAIESTVTFIEKFEGKSQLPKRLDKFKQKFVYR